MMARLDRSRGLHRWPRACLPGPGQLLCLLSAAGLSALLSACSGLAGPEYSRPEVPGQASWSQPPPGMSLTTTIRPDWWRGSHHPYLNRLESRSSAAFYRCWGTWGGGGCDAWDAGYWPDSGRTIPWTNPHTVSPAPQESRSPPPLRIFGTF
jgi:hypothetical protein